MKRLITLIVCLFTSIMMFADRVSQNEALKKAQAFMPGERFELQKYSASVNGQTVENPFYIFNVEKNGGYVIVSGDDRTVPILGYSTNGNVDLSKLPDNFRSWLESYAAQLKAIDEGKLIPVTKAGTRGDRTNIDPLLVTTRWDQGEPYNLMCPDGNGVDYNQQGYDQGYRCVTGCVATATAQVMYYHKKPSTTTAIPEYSLKINGNTVTLNTLPSTSFKWDKMKDSYDYDESGEAADAVAELMRYVGQAFRLNYGIAANGGTAGNALLDVMINNFGYSKYIHRIYRDDYTVTQWENMVYDELAKSRPLPYNGFSETGGHFFVCDGYKNGFFHLNWGWGGRLDGDFILSIADPNGEQGIGGSDGAYKYGQSTYLNFVPAGENEEEIPLFESSIYSQFSEYTRSSTSGDFTDVRLTGKCWAMYPYKPTTTYDAEIGWGLYQDERLRKCVGSYQQTIDNRDLDVGWYTYWENSLDVSFGADLTDGKYELRQMTRKAGTQDQWTLCDGYGNNYLVAEINGTSLRIRKGDGNASAFTVSDITVSGQPYVGNEVMVSFNLTNVGDSDQEQVTLWAAEEGTEDWKIVANVTSYIRREKTDNVTLYFTPTEAGTFSLKITSGSSEEALGTTSITVADVKNIEINDIVYRCIPDYGYAIVVGVGSGFSRSSVEIPASVTADGKVCAVREIGNNAFYRSGITSLTLPEGIVSIGFYAFTYNQLSELILPSSLKVIGTAAFESCGQIKSLTIPEGLEVINQYAFWNCSSLQKVDLPSSLTYIGELAFNYCSSLNAVVSHIEEPTAVAVDDNAFATQYWDSTDQPYYTPSPATLYVPVGSKEKYEAIVGWTKFAKIEEGELLEAVVDHLKYSYLLGNDAATVIGSDLETIGDLTIPASVTIDNQLYHVKAIGSSAFANSGVSSLTLAEGIVSIGSYAFYNNQLSELILPSSLKVIGTAAFESCRQIKSLTIPEGMEVINQYAFWNCNSLQKVDLPSSLTYIGELAFNYCSSLNAVVSHIEEPTAVAVDDNAFATQYWDSTDQPYYTPSPATLYVPVGSKEKYEAIVGWTKFAKIEEGEPLEAVVDHLKYSYLLGNDAATVIGSDLETIGDLTIPASVTINGQLYHVKAIGANAFENSGVSSLTLAEGIESIGNGAFRWNYMSDFTLPNSLKSIGDQAFWNCNDIINVVIPEGVESIGNQAFGACYGLQKLVLPSSLTSIGQYVVQYSTALTTVLSHIQEPLPISDDTFVLDAEWDDATQQNLYTQCPATLYVPVGKKNAYEAIPGWTKFDGGIKELQEMGGDVNGDGKVTVSDVVTIISYILGDQQATGIDPTAADVNGDGQVTIADAVQALGLISNP